MHLSTGTRLGPYEIVGPLGAGGMGVVYRARDTALGRDVAIKVLPEAFAKDPERVARFEREAKALASLTHPNIAQVFGLQDGALVMELLDGETLGSRLAGGALPVRKSIEYAGQIARGLAAAHERGITHRDLKPENVFVLRDGQVKILDFGLARQAPTPAFGATLTAAGAGGTEPGTVMGTVGYMSPEQVRGDALDSRTDLFAFGAVLYEMLAGQRAFRRDTPAETMTAILNEDPPDLTAARADLSPALDRIVRHCLEKNPIERFQTARDVAFALDALSGSGFAGAATPTAGTQKPSRERWVWASITAVLAIATTWQGLAPRLPEPESPTAVYHTRLALPEGVSMAQALPPVVRLAISPDGRRVVFVGLQATTQKLWMMSLDEPEARAIDGSENGIGPFWSPDGQRVVFSSGGRMKIARIDGGTPTDLGPGGFGEWSTEDALILNGGPPDFRLRRVTATGENAIELVAPADGEIYSVPSFLPGNRRLLFGYRNLREPATSGVYVATPDMKERTLVIAGNDATGVTFANGAVLFVRGSALLAQAFDPDTLKVSGEPSVIAEYVDADTRGAAYSVSRNGTMVYAPTHAQAGARLVWMDRDGRALSRLGDEADYSNVELSPDGKRVLVSVTDPAARARDIHIIDVARGIRQRLTFDPSDERSAAWSPDGRHVVYTSKGLDLYMRPSDFSGDSTPVEVTHRSKDPREVSPDGSRVLYRQTGESTGNDLWVVRLEGDRAPTMLLGTRFDENYAGFSPDGRSIVYTSDESGQAEVYVMSLEGGRKLQLSAGGGTFPRWRSGGREIFYLRADQTLMSVAVSGTGATFPASTPRPLFRIDVQPGFGTPYDVTADGQRFIVNTALSSQAQTSLNLIVNWPALIGQK